MNELVSVYLVHRNYSDNVKTAIECVLNQDYPNIEFIIVDYGSDDRNLAKLVKCINNSKIKFYYYPCNTFIGAIMYAITKCTGKWVIRADADDHMFNKCVSEQVHSATKDQSAITIPCYSTDDDPYIDGAEHNLTCQALVERDKYQLVRYTPDQVFRDGTSLINTFKLLGLKITYLPIMLFEHRIHNTSLTANKSLVEIDRNIEQYLHEYHSRLI